MKNLIKTLIQESLAERQLVQHMKNALGYARNDLTLEAQQIVDDWLTEIELETDDLLAPGLVTTLERFAYEAWPTVRSRFNENIDLALLTMKNLLDARLGELL